MPLNKTLNEAVQGDGIRLLGSNDIQDLYQITSQVGVTLFEDLNNQSAASGYGLNEASWNSNIGNGDDPAYLVYAIAIPNTNRLKYMILKPTAQGELFEWEITLPEGKQLTLTADSFPEYGQNHNANIISAEHPVDFTMLQNITTFANIDDLGFIYEDEDKELVIGYYPQIFNIEAPNSITINGEFCLNWDRCSLMVLLKQFSDAGVKIVCIDNTIEEGYDTAVLTQLSGADEAEWSSIFSRLNEEEMYLFMKPDFYADIEENLPEHHERLFVANNFDLAQKDIESEIANQRHEKEKLERRKNNKLIFKEVGNQIHVVGCKRTPTVQNLIIPDEINGKRVTVIGEAAFSGNKSVGTLYLPKYLKRIEADAFYDSNMKLKFYGNELANYAYKITVENLNALNTTAYNLGFVVNKAEVYEKTNLKRSNINFKDLINNLMHVRNGRDILVPNNISSLYYDPENLPRN